MKNTQYVLTGAIVGAVMALSAAWYYLPNQAVLGQTSIKQKLLVTPVVEPMKQLGVGIEANFSTAAKEISTETSKMQNIGEYLDPEGDPNLGRFSSEIIIIGEYLDPEGDPNLGRELNAAREIGDYLDPEADQNLGRDPGPVVNIGEYINADEYFYGNKTNTESIDFGDNIDPEDVN